MHALVCHLKPDLQLRLARSIAEIAPVDWDALFVDGGPFVEHRFLAALEASGCVGAERGWQPMHALLEDGRGQLVAAAPLYLKDHSWGEFVFDFAWAEASHRLGRRYYPKWLCAVPFTPVRGARLGARDAAAGEALATALAALVDDDFSSLHVLFPRAEDDAALRGAGCIERNDLQYHWRNRGYTDFADFAADLSSEKRKKMLRERRRVAEAGLQHRWQAGEELSEAEWAQVYALYANTYDERGQLPYLNLQFFLDYGRAPGSPVRLVSAFDGERRVAVAITIQSGDSLYGRHWGAAEHYHSLHFETCYHQGIEYCVRHGLQHFDAGTQGRHKLARGFLPEITRSFHRLADPGLHAVIAQATARERRQVARYRSELAGHSPFREGDAPPVPGSAGS